MNIYLKTWACVLLVGVMTSPGAADSPPLTPDTAPVYTTDPLLESLVFPPRLRASLVPQQQRDLLIPAMLLLDIVKLALIKKAIKNKKCKKNPKKKYCKKKPTGSPAGSPLGSPDEDTELGVQGDENIDEIVLQTFPALVPEVLPETLNDIDTSSLIDDTSATARAKIRFGGATGDVFFAESKLYADSKGRPKTIISGKMRGLPPGRHTIKIHRSGDIRGECDRVGAVNHVRENII